MAEQKIKHTICLSSMSDFTKVEIETTGEQFEFLLEVARQVNAKSKDAYMPKMFIDLEESEV